MDNGSIMNFRPLGTPLSMHHKVVLVRFDYFLHLYPYPHLSSFFINPAVTVAFGIKNPASTDPLQRLRGDTASI